MIIDKIKKAAVELLSEKKADVVIGYVLGNHEYVHAYFAKTPEEAEKLVFDEKCDRNLAVYLIKNEVKEIGKAAVVARPSVMRSILQLASENQIDGDNIVIIGVSNDGDVNVFHDLNALTEYMKTIPFNITPEQKKKIAEYDALTPGQRWEFWKKEFHACIKCYACRASCPLCYCTRCMVETNQPQWVHVTSHELGNLEWHIMRAMHLAGRCINCGECYRACPMDIPLNLLTQKLTLEIENSFGVKPAEGHEQVFVLATFKPDDKENFIG